jgi:hypothetical protein
MHDGKFQSFFIVPPQFQAHSPDELFRWMTKALFELSVLALLLFAGWIWSGNRNRTNDNYGLRSLFWIATCSAVCIVALRMQGYNSTWYPIEKAMTFTANPPYVHRVLFVLIAKLVKSVTGLSDIHSFFISQFIAIVLAMTAILKWAELFIDKSQTFLAPVLLAAMLVPTFSYFTFYDIGIVFFYSAGLTMLLQRRWAYYLILLSVGVLNHENILLMIIVSAVVCYSEKKWLSFLAVQLSLYLAIRAVLFHWIPVSRAWAQGTIWINIYFFLFSRGILISTAIQLLWFALSLLIARVSAPTALKRCTILLPLLLVVSVLVGQLNESRLAHT